MQYALSIALCREHADTGFLAAVEDSQVVVGGIMGTSSGALAGALFSAGYSAQQVRGPAHNCLQYTPGQAAQPAVGFGSLGALSAQMM
jgi:hypothetical protein